MADIGSDREGVDRATLERLRELADIHGGELARWPQAAREEAGDLLARTGEAGARVLDEAAALAAMLDAYEVEPPSVALETAILEGFNAASRNRARGGGGRGFWAVWAPGLLRPRVLAGAAASLFVVSFSAGYAGAAYVQPAGADGALALFEEVDSLGWSEPGFEDMLP